MLDKLRVTAKNSFIYGLGNFATKFVGLFLLPLYTSEFSIEEYGVIGLLEVTVRILVAFFGLNLFNAFFRWYWDKELIRNRRSLFFTVLISVVVISSAVSAMGLFLSKSLSTVILDDSKYLLVFRLAIISAAFETVSVIPFTLLRLQGKASKYTITYIVRLIVNVTLNIILILRFNRGIESIYYASIAGSVVYLILLIPYMVKNSELKFESTILKSMLGYSLPLLLSSISTILLSITDRYVLQFLVGSEEVGLYSLGFKLANTIRFLLIVPINMAVLPIFYKMIGDEGSEKFYARFTTYYAYIVGFAVLGMSLFAEYVVKVFARNSDYWSSFLVVPFISLSILFGMLKDMSLTGLHIKRRTGFIAIITISLTALNIGLNILFIPAYKSIGASIATLIVQFLFFVIVLWIAQRTFYIPYEIKRILLLVVNIIGLYLLSKLFINYTFFINILISFGFFLLYPVTLLLFRFYKPKEFISILGFLRKWKNPRNWKDELIRLAREKEE